MVVDNPEGLSELGRGRWMVGSQQRGQDALTELGIGNGKAETVFAERVGVGVLEASDQAFICSVSK